VKPIKIEIDAASVGVKNILVQVTTLPEERNTANNQRTSSLEVIDEKTNIALISDVLHPDLGTLKKAIESNEQREVSLFKANSELGLFEETDLFVFYEPTASFTRIMDFAKRKNANTLIIAGIHTDYSFLNEAKWGFEIESGYPVQTIFGLLNKGFDKYDISNFYLSNFPPLESDAGPILFQQPYSTLLGTQIKGMDMEKPLIAVWNDNTTKKGIVLGAGLWKWRMQTFRTTGNFNNFDEFLGNLIRYLTGNANTSRLNVEYERRYEGSTDVVITATYFDEAFLFDANAKLSIAVENSVSKERFESPMVLKNGYFEADLSNLTPGRYAFTVTVENETNVEDGVFSISEFNLENQFVSSDDQKLRQLANASGGKQWYPSQIALFLEELVTNQVYVPTEKSTENIVSLIDFKILLAIIAISFSAEWFIRKYNGLI
ncbi:MAG: VWA domain-containing protein, partial [Maribacter sp.]